MTQILFTLYQCLRNLRPSSCLRQCCAENDQEKELLKYQPFFKKFLRNLRLNSRLTPDAPRLTLLTSCLVLKKQFSEQSLVYLHKRLFVEK